MPVRIAIVDDHSLVRGALSELISAQRDIDVVAAVGDGASALRIVRDARPDVLLLDITLPDGSGLDLIGPICRCSPTTRVLVLSMHSEPAYATQARDRGARGLIAKSSPLEELIRAIHVVAAGGVIPVEGELTDRERDVLAQIGRGASGEEIATSLGLRPRTVEAYSQRLMDKFGVHTRAGLVGIARRFGLERIPD